MKDGTLKKNEICFASDSDRRQQDVTIEREMRGKEDPVRREMLLLGGKREEVLRGVRGTLLHLL